MHFSLFFPLPLHILITLHTVLAQDLPLRYRIEEEQPVGTVVGDIVKDSNLPGSYSAEKLAEFTYKFLRPRNDFSVNLQTGVISIANVIDRDVICASEMNCALEVDVTVTLQQKHIRHVIKVIFEILDINDNSPQFPKEHINMLITEATLPGPLFPIQQAIDRDSPPLGVVRYQLLPEGPTFELKAEKSEGRYVDIQLILKERLDHEKQDTHQVRLIAYDGGRPPNTGTVMIHIQIEDVNDNSPVFVNDTYEVVIDENSSPKRSLLQVRATDKDSGVNGVVCYAFSPRAQSLHGDRFGIDKNTGVLSLKKSLDYEQGGSIPLEVVAKDGGESSIPTTARVMITVRDLNDNAPEIRVETTDAQQSGTGINPVVYVKEHCPIGTFVAHLSISDLDAGTNGEVRCTLQSAQFRLVQMYDTEFKVLTASDLDHEYVAVHHVPIACHDMGQSALTSVLNITVFVEDVNDHAPVFTQTSYNWSIVENSQPNTFIGQVKAEDPDKDENGKVTYELNLDAEGLVVIDRDTGFLTTSQSLDRETTPSLRFHVIARDGSKTRNFSSAAVNIQVLDLDDEGPHFVEKRYVFRVEEDVAIQHEIGRLTAYDRDNRPFNRFTYYLNTTGNGINLQANPFGVEPNTGVLFTRQPLSARVHGGLYNLTVGVQSETVPKLTDSAIVIVHILKPGSGQIPSLPPYDKEKDTDPLQADEPGAVQAREGELFSLPLTGVQLAVLIGAVMGFVVILSLLLMTVCACKRRRRKKKKIQNGTSASAAEVTFWSNPDMMGSIMDRGKKGGSNESGREPVRQVMSSDVDSSSDDDLEPPVYNGIEPYNNYTWKNSRADQSFLSPSADEFVTQASRDFSNISTCVSPHRSNYSLINANHNQRSMEDKMLPDFPKLSKLSTFSDCHIDACGSDILYQYHPTTMTPTTSGVHTHPVDNGNYAALLSPGLRAATLDRRAVVQFQEEVEASHNRVQSILAERARLGLNQEMGEGMVTLATNFPPPPPPLDIDRFLQSPARLNSVKLT